MNAKYLQSVCYLDTNILIYMFDNRDIAKQQCANKLYLHFLTNGLGRISVMVMSEWRNAMIRKFKHLIDGSFRREFLESLIALNPLKISPDTLVKADILSEQYSLSPYDAVHLQCALELNCRYFLSEDIQHGLVLQGTLTVWNPFLLEEGMK